MSVGDVIKQHRNMLNLTQRELGDSMCHAGNTVCFWESGRSTPNIYEIPKLCRELKISPNGLFEWEVTPKTDEQLINEIQMLIARRRGK